MLGFWLRWVWWLRRRRDQAPAVEPRADPHARTKLKPSIAAFASSSALYPHDARRSCPQPATHTVYSRRSSRSACFCVKEPSVGSVKPWSAHRTAQHPTPRDRPIGEARRDVPEMPKALRRVRRRSGETLLRSTTSTLVGAHQ
jgi:hypothetical protein